ncbi:MAG: hypothetical protein MJ166_10780 [Clostridia bacterium]|nr:hypothetical protein [Clostridia bacterium]
MNIKVVQKRIIDNKISKGFGITEVNKEFLLLYGEVAEAYGAYLKGDMVELGSELADVAIYLLGLAKILDIDIEDEIERKLDINEKRVYVKLPNGEFVKKTC